MRFFPGESIGTEENHGWTLMDTDEAKDQEEDNGDEQYWWDGIVRVWGNK
jgi:hypothetical protein